MEIIRGNTLILDGKPADASDFNPEASAGILYEVFRVINGHCLFLMDHLERLRNSCTVSNHTCPPEKTLISDVELLLETTDIDTGNIKLLVYEQEGTLHTAAFFVPHFYPTKEDYVEGVSTKTYRFERPDPTIKRWNAPFREAVREFIEKENIYEAILVNDKGLITEGSRSNLFFIEKNNSIVSAPESMVLPGITRKHVYKICEKKRITYHEREISVSDLGGMKACFLSGTSPKILPVKRIDNFVFDVNNAMLSTLMEVYEALILDQIRN